MRNSPPGPFADCLLDFIFLIFSFNNSRFFFFPFFISMYVQKELKNEGNGIVKKRIKGKPEEFIRENLKSAPTSVSFFSLVKADLLL